MTAAERLAAALQESELIRRYQDYARTAFPRHMIYEDPVVVADHWAEHILAADPALAQALADGLALAALREALPEGWYYEVHHLPGRVLVTVGQYTKKGEGRADTIAAAAEGCREALTP